MLAHRLSEISAKGISHQPALPRIPSFTTGLLGLPASWDGRAYSAPKSLDAGRTGQSHGRWRCP